MRVLRLSIIHCAGAAAAAVATLHFVLLQAWPPLDVALLRAGQDNAALERLCRLAAAKCLDTWCSWFAAA